HRRWATGAFSGATAPPGWVLNRRSPYMIGITNAGVGHTAGTLNGVNVESRGGDGVVVGSRARSYKSSLFTHRYGYAGTYDQGGLLPPGLSAIYNGTSKPEAVLTGAQFNALAGSGDRIGAAVVAGMAQMGSAVEAAADRLGRSAAPAGVVPVTSSGGRAPAGAGPDGRPLYLLLEDGTAIRAYVSDRVDDALTDVRRAKRAGKK
ncbi:MAG TPA: replication protein, partial [Streptomyces sp.]|nr:replication protein [Streptomyces sp.]